MCSQRIDAAYSHLPSINEKKDPKERFIQLMDELSIDGDTKAYLESKFSANFYDWFYNADQAEKALVETKKFQLLRDKVAVFLKESYPCKSFIRDMDLYSKGQEISADQKKKIKFSLDIARSFFPNSLYGLYSSEFRNLFRLTFPQLSTVLHDEEYCFSSICFDDPSLNSLDDSKRTEFLWSIFNELNAYQIIISKKQKIPNWNNYELLVDFIKSETNDSNHQSVEENLYHGFRFLKSWITNDARNGRSFSELVSVINEIYYHLDCRLYCSDYPENNEVTLPWLRDFKLELQWLLLQHFDLSKASDAEVEVWTDQIEELYKVITYKIEDREDVPYIKQEHVEFNKLVKALPNDSVMYWLQSNIRQDIKKTLQKSLSPYNLLQSKWCFGETYNAWKAEFLQQLNQLNAFERMKLLSIAPPFPGQPSNLSEDAPDFYKEHAIWWNSLYLELPKNEDFEKQYLPEWTIAAQNKAGTPNLVPYIDQSIGILRGQVFNEGSDSVDGKLMLQLSELLTWLENANPEKALRHRLILFRSSKTPLCDEGLNYRTKAEDCLWYQPLKDLKPSFNHSTTGSANEELLAFYQAMSKQISEFCLSRLQLRKKEKAVDGKYSSNQVVEMSTTWRQGYLKAITEIGLDLNGKTHKAAYFIKQGDEDENVRAIAAEAYKAVRRSDNNNPSIADLKRGIIAAEWWLLHCQRQELGLNINFEEALKTRRRLLRNP